MSLKARVLLLFSLPLLGFFTHGLFDLDEGFYGAVVAEMNRRGDWITPWFNGAPWFEKPILLYWLSKPLVAIFGFDLGSRLGVVLASIGVAAAVFEFAKRQFGEDVAGTAVLILGSSLLWAALSRMMMTDTLLAGAYGLAVMALWERRYAWTGFCLGLTVLAKGPVGLILITPLFLLWAVREKPSWKGFGWGVLTLVATVASWYVPAYVVNGQLFVQKFLIEQNVQRFLGGTPPTPGTTR